ncbi:ferric reductase like transmembrane component-domain-containing protein [Triangularia setosa]|uniref:Ferric reductase like transmembrane component-domain-containing protein n=1 Tax=Triangularia setosa TaxID=2587417 RepID=A0AAN7A9G6_9PEZI|nr:ferric reductase like transmembrane component-domain-containing protein [Podospora setosa]
MDHAQLCALPAQQLLPGFIRTIYCQDALATLEETGTGDPLAGLTPEQLEYIRQLIIAIYEGRAITASYNVLIIGIIAVFAVLHWREQKRDKQKWTAIQQAGARRTTTRNSEVDGSGTSTPSSSSLTTVVQSTHIKSPEDEVDVDLERLPLLRNSQLSNQHLSHHIANKLRSFLLYQPPPIPIITRVLPSNGTSLFILAWLALNIAIQFYRLPLKWSFFFIFADRAGFLFIVNLPLLYLLSAKNQPLRRLTGYSYEALNIFHRKVGEWMCFVGIVHFISMLLYQFVLAEDWLLASQSPKAYFTHPLILFGIGAFVSYELLFFTSLGSFRQRWYELFLALHVVLQVAALGFLWGHFYTSRPYVVTALAIFLIDRLVWRMSIKRVSMEMDLTVLDGETFLVSGDWDILPEAKGVLAGWEPTDHVFLTVPVLGRSHALQAHPFTIASDAPGKGLEGEERKRHAWFSLLIRAQFGNFDRGFTGQLLEYAKMHKRVEVQLDGPYGSPHALSILRASENVILVAGGSGIAVTFPLVWALLHEARSQPEVEDEDEDKQVLPLRKQKKGGGRKVHMLWVTHAFWHQRWIPKEQLDELVALGLDLVMPKSTMEAGRPDVRGIVGQWIQEAEGDTSVLVSGPDGLNRVVRNVAADAVGHGKGVRIAVEKFGW